MSPRQLLPSCPPVLQQQQPALQAVVPATRNNAQACLRCPSALQAALQAALPAALQAALPAAPKLRCQLRCQLRCKLRYKLRSNLRSV